VSALTDFLQPKDYSRFTKEEVAMHRLADAAPDLLHALQELLPIVTTRLSQVGAARRAERKRVFEQAYAAVEKATGVSCRRET